jgi:hypothetical protein
LILKGRLVHLNDQPRTFSVVRCSCSDYLLISQKLVGHRAPGDVKDTALERSQCRQEASIWAGLFNLARIHFKEFQAELSFEIMNLRAQAGCETWSRRAARRQLSSPGRANAEAVPVWFICIAQSMRGILTATLFALTKA